LSRFHYNVATLGIAIELERTRQAIAVFFNVSGEGSTMKRRMLFKAVIVIGLVVATLLPGKKAHASSRAFCYTCYHADSCPDGVMGDMLCWDIGGELCPVMNTCVELAPECRYFGDQWMLITCQSAP
jgi:hypothetical protein